MLLPPQGASKAIVIRYKNANLSMKQPPEVFKAMRPYTDAEVKAVIEQLLADSDFKKVLQDTFPQKESEMRATLAEVDSIRAFQVQLIYPFLLQIEASSTDGLFFEGWEALDKEQSYLFISNHRDIFLDAGLFSGLLYREGFETAANAIGDNLLRHPVAERLAKLNRSFVVKRSLQARELLAYTQLLSSYIQYCLHEEKTSIWIAQRSGRSKSGDDRTFTALLKMLSGRLQADELVPYFKRLRIVPLAISYEFEPCAGAKARETLIRAQGLPYEKQRYEDLLHIQRGIQQPKGRVSFHLAPQLDSQLDALQGLPRNEGYQALARLIDEAIHRHYQLRPNNYIAADRLSAQSPYAQHYSPQDEQRFEQHLQQEMQAITDVDAAALEEQLLRLYAQPLRNKEG